MIKATFYNLSKEKRNDWVDIAKYEFASHPINEVTVKNIANRYGIARSSFYNYFDGVEDLFYYVLEEYRSKFVVKLKESIEYNKGDVFKIIIDIFDYIIDNDDSEVDFMVLRNIFITAGPLIQKMILPMDRNKFSIEIESLDVALDKSFLKIDDEKVLVLIEVLLDLLIENIIHFFVDRLDKDEAKILFNLKMDIIKCGVCRE